MDTNLNKLLVMQVIRVLNRITFRSVISVFSVAYLLVLMAGCGDNEPAETSESMTGQADTYMSNPDGKALFDLYCIGCHGAGPGNPGTQRLEERLSADQAPLLDRDNLQPDYVKLVVREGFKLMPPFRPSEITDEQLDLMTDYITGENH